MQSLARTIEHRDRLLVTMTKDGRHDEGGEAGDKERVSYLTNEEATVEY